MNEVKNTYTLLIIFRDGFRKVIPNVENFGFFGGDYNTFKFIKDGLYNFIPREAVIFFGNYEHYYGREYSDDQG